MPSRGSTKPPLAAPLRPILGRILREPRRRVLDGGSAPGPGCPRVTLAAGEILPAGALGSRRQVDANQPANGILMWIARFELLQTYFDPLGQALKEIREAQHPALGPRVLKLLCLGARLLSAIAPMCRSEFAHLLPPAVPSFYNLTRIPNRRTLWLASVVLNRRADR
jgi:hypothetical protein